MQPTSALNSLPQFLYSLFRHVLPRTRRELARWTAAAQAIPDPQLRQQALASLQHKRFHADGGCVYAAGAPAAMDTLVELIVALQTISDYLDNLCDRCGRVQAADFACLHQAMCDAVTPGAPLHAYYQWRTGADDGGYLAALVRTCQACVSRLPGYAGVQPHVLWLVERYCELQVHKHVDPLFRAQRLQRWWSAYADRYPGVHWWEFAAASGSTLGVFALFLAATEDVPRHTGQLLASYFPWICGLHILLDYLIDLEEDAQAGDFNFIRCYPSPAHAQQRLRWFAEQSWRQANTLLANHRLHREVVRGLLAMYLSDHKASQQRDVRPVRQLLWRFGPAAWTYYAACQVYRCIR